MKTIALLTTISGILATVPAGAQDAEGRQACLASAASADDGVAKTTQPRQLAHMRSRIPQHGTALDETGPDKGRPKRPGKKSPPHGGETQRKTAPALQLPPVNLSDPPRDYVVHEVCGWAVWVEKQLLDDTPDLAKTALGRLKEKLGIVAAKLPPATLPDLRKVKVFLLYGPKAAAGGRSNGLEYFQATAPNHSGWLDRRMGGSIVIFNADNYVKLTEFWALKSLVHEFGHAHHLEHWPENRADIYDTWKRAMDSGLYQVVRKEDEGKHLPNYAAQNHLEYVAELTAMYFVDTNYYPTDRDGLRSYDRKGYELIRKLWGVDDSTSAKP